ncbi:MAG: acyl-[acyl-carrier-protein]--UDP-N-acetylglucosamine O-acyltransferase [Ignavibacteria bacterium GWA2_55_11]|nr:MAG: acyl-[acyl-carrier-protein]--UDP-N-acetylglucosamine O-acyltransferase [Ignavibacteria bacterium GWA2_55_11]OGU46451.1 MAG: acyl-[acyl-carrier-protein]--UDP-N-acetylglucosamine O-acyltransferase [Ignavibacteria bacterium GWC2_56_12]OGU64044.1 MAG: acyl-[acyl-carrier-protein]--UDP-N-acetylglucosamine O-acyltransferase [Ignavibacteria bacterium RIFCSPHIGHO2_02_FULL_56_12]OGU72319.1 MAG: acyl-[acyl-carrier-protein]--UDP-N-acetylglucosamine O-acyltransferase [Ignavibacteria bacterium RIFCSPL
MPTQVHPTAVVGNKTQLGERVVIGPYVVVEDDVVIGEGTTVGAHAFIGSGTRLGRECRVHPFASVGGPPQDLKYKGEPTLLEVGDRCTVREYVTLNRGTVESGKTMIGSDCLFMANAHVGHDCRVGNRVILANSVALGGHVHLGDWVIIGGVTPVHQFCKVGDHAMVGGGFRVVKDVPPYILCGQEPLVFEGLNSVGLKRRGFLPHNVEVLEQTYQVLYRSNLNVSQAVAKIKEMVEQTTEVHNVLAFIASSKRGIISGRSKRA